MNEKIRTGLVVAAFAACCFGYAWVGAYALLLRWAIADPEQDPVHLLFKRLTRSDR